MADTVRFFAFVLAEAFLRGPWNEAELITRVQSVLTPHLNGARLKSLVGRVVHAFREQPRPLSAALIRYLKQDELFVRYCKEHALDDLPNFEIDLGRLDRPSMQPAAGAASSWAVKPLVTVGEVADWLGTTVGELDWFADCRGRECQLPEGPLRHYRYRWIVKTSGGRRLLEIPKSRLKTIQRKILNEILSAIPPHPSAHAYRHGRSIATCVAPHAGKRIILHIDLRDFFPSVRASQVHALFRTAGYPERVASVLTGLCTNVTPQQVFDTHDCHFSSNPSWKRYGSAHLPQGAPTSPALANLAAFWLDCRLSGLARKVKADYTRYADDLVFSGGDELAKCSSRFRVLVAAIAHHEGFDIRRRKTREMLSGSRQQVAGVILNQHANIPRREYDLLRAILHNCRESGPATQNIENHPHFREHLLGRIAYWSTICPDRAGKLRSLFERIDWS